MMEIPNENENQLLCEKIHWTSNDYQENIIVSQIKFPLFIRFVLIEIIQLFFHSKKTKILVLLV